MQELISELVRAIDSRLYTAVTFAHTSVSHLAVRLQSSAALYACWT